MFEFSICLVGAILSRLTAQTAAEEAELGRLELTAARFSPPNLVLKFNITRHPG